MQIIWNDTDAMIEVGSPKNRERIFNFFYDLDVNLFAQKKNLLKVKNLEDMHAGYKEGAFFILFKEVVPW